MTIEKSTDRQKLATIFQNNSTGVENPFVWKKFDEVDQTIERVSKFFDVAFKLTSYGLVVPSLIVTFVNYFIYGLGSESYYLSWPMWYVYRIYELDVFTVEIEF